ncbi:MAG TPA: peptidylprolyl isomerase [Methanoregula sp.]|nr:peptidylprolyl isomerase [Methanoregula sp.]
MTGPVSLPGPGPILRTIGKTGSPSQDDAQSFYSRISSSLYMAQQARASHILVKTEEQANQIMKRLADGEEFAKVARRFSSCPSGKNGGDLGWFGKGMMVPEFEKVAFDEEVGKVVGPIKTQFGYHVIKVTGKK